eukprot:598445-Amorphochlora_amoeboformis.AAC.1
MAPQTVHPSVGLRDRLVRRYRQTCVASHNVRVSELFECMRISCNFPMSRLQLWSLRPTCTGLGMSVLRLSHAYVEYRQIHIA